MQILHIVPAAFEYFEDIRKEAFDLVDSLNSLGYDCEIITLQYSAVSKRLEKQVAQETKQRMQFEKIYNDTELKEQMDKAEIIHLHVPFLGMGKKLLKYKQDNPQKKFIITFHQNLPYTDFFTIIIWLYNSFYLRRLVNLADFVVAENEQIFRQGGGFSYLKDLKKFVSLDNFIDFIIKNDPNLTERLNSFKLDKSNIHTAVAYGELYRLLSGE